MEPAWALFFEQPALGKPVGNAALALGAPSPHVPPPLPPESEPSSAPVKRRVNAK